MSSAGHIKDMIGRLKENRALLHSRKPGFRASIEIKETKRTFLRFKKVSDPELSNLKKKIRYKIYLENRRVLVISIVVAILFSVAYAWFLFWR